MACTSGCDYSFMYTPSKVTRSLGQQVVITGLQEVTNLTDMLNSLLDPGFSLV